MSYIIKNSTQGAIVARLTDAGRKKLSEGKLNISLFQLGDSEMCYDCYSTLPTQLSSGINILQAEHNAQNLTPLPEKNKGHVKYPLNGGIATGDTFGPTIAQHTYEEVFNTATARGFFEVPTQTPAEALVGAYTSFSANTGSSYTLSSNWTTCFSALTGTTTLAIVSATCSTQNYTPVVGDLLSITYGYSGTNCSELNYTAASQTLFYQVLGGNSNSAQTNVSLTLTVDRVLPNYSSDTTTYSAFTGTCMYVKVYPSFSANPLTTSSIYNTAATTSDWCDDTLSFNNCSSASATDVKIWNMNINWTHTVAGVTTPTYESAQYYGSSGYCGSKEYFGLESDNGQTFFGDVKTDTYHGVSWGTWYYDSFDNVRTVLPSQQKCAGFIHYTNNTTTDFYGEKFALKQQGYNPLTTIGEAKNFKLHLPWLMWHKKSSNGSGTGTGAGNETELGQTFYVDPPGYNVFPTQPNIMQSNLNINMNDDGLRYYTLWDDNAGSGTTPNRVGKVFPDYKMLVIDDEELLTAMSYKSNRSWTLPAPKTNKLPAGTCDSTGCTSGVLQAVGDTLYVTYFFTNGTGMTTGLHCNYYVHETLSPGEDSFDLSVTFGPEFPYLRDFTAGGTGFEADGLHLLTQVVPNGGVLQPTAWKYKTVTNEIPNHVVGGKIQAPNLINKTFNLTGNDFDASCLCCYSALTAYTLNTFITIPQTGIDSEKLQFGDEYFLYGTIETDIMATIYEMKHVVQLGTNEFVTSTNPTWTNYNNNNNTITTPLLTEVGLFDNENGFPDLMAIAKFQNPVQRTGTQQFVIAIDF